MEELPNIFLIGPMGVGKTSVGHKLAKLLHRPFYDSDYEIMHRTGVTIQWIFEVEKEAGFRRREVMIIDQLTQLQHIVLSTGGGSIVTEVNRKKLKERGFVVYLTVDTDTQIERATRRDVTRPLLQVDDPKQRLLELNREREPLYRETADLVIDTTSLDADDIAETIVDAIVYSMSQKKDR